ncbi:MAG TPA: ATP-binding cassette domain-containing protein, partial [Rhodocyclaceae bacterium]|nr:ATP-binding cassette domain-containing protein [Rhodocyclaceae bacterium]
MEPNLLLAVRDLRIAFRVDRSQPGFEAVKGISFDIPENATVALVGESGSGKSVSALAILGLLPTENATVLPGSRILYGGRNLVGLSNAELRELRGREISMIFQEPMSSLNPVFTVGDQIAEVLRLHLGLSSRQAQVRVLELLDEVGIPDPLAKSRAHPFQL